MHAGGVDKRMQVVGPCVCIRAALVHPLLVDCTFHCCARRKQSVLAMYACAQLVAVGLVAGLGVPMGCRVGVGKA